MWFENIKIPLRWRLVVLSACGLLCLLILFLFFVYSLLKNWLIDSEQFVLEQKLHSISNLYQQTPLSSPQMVRWLETYLEEGQAFRIAEHDKVEIEVNKGVPKAIYRAFHPSGENKQMIQWNGEQAVVLKAALPNGQRMELYSLFTVVNHKLSSIMTILVASSSLLLVFVVFGGALMNSIAFRPIQKIIREVQEFNPAHQSHRLEIPDTGDEIASLSQVINKLLDRIYDLIQKQNRFVGDASHELRTPISVIRGYLDLLRRWGMKKPEVAREAMDMMDQELKRIEKMTKQLLQLARFDGNDAETGERETFSVNQVVEERVRCWRRVIKEIAIHAHVPKFSILMEGDRTDFVELLDILLDNAGKYTKKGGEIFVSLEMEKKEMKLSVRDTGLGIPEEDLPHVFERFYRVKKVRSTHSGSGLGLSIARQIVRKYNGRLEIASKVGKGTTISAFFPNSNQILI